MRGMRAYCILIIREASKARYEERPTAPASYNKKEGSVTPSGAGEDRRLGLSGHIALDRGM